MRILIIDDEITALTKMKLLLAPYGECALVTNAGQAMQLVVKAIQDGRPFDLVTIDIQLGDANGHDLLESINQHEIREGVPAAKKIMVTASGTKKNLLKAYVNGCDGFLVKPVKRDALEQKLAGLGLAMNNAG
jgi:two-component system, chemotaxis family, chemotaxis protein CheY